MIRYLRGIITFLLVLINAIFVICTTIPIGLLRFLPIPPLQRGVLKVNEEIGALYLYFNSRIQDLMHNVDYVVEGDDKLKKDILAVYNDKSFKLGGYFCIFIFH